MAKAHLTPEGWRCEKLREHLGVYFEACAAGRLLLVEPHAEALERPEVAQRVIA